MTKHVFFVFLDGIGIAPNSNDNPFSTIELPGFTKLSDNQKWISESKAISENDQVFKSIDANLGIDGLPQSGTGQATLFSGVNCSEAAGRHFGPYPHSTSKPILTEKNIFTQWQESGKGKTAFANAYPDRFFEMMDKRNRRTVTTFCCDAAGVHLNKWQDAKAGRALTAGLTGAGWNRYFDYGLKEITEFDAGRRFHNIGREHQFTLFEFFQTDKAGHKMDFDYAKQILLSVDAFLSGILDQFDPEVDLLILTSDHGNLEDLSVKTHTRNPVPFVAFGAGANYFKSIDSIQDVVPALMQIPIGM